MKIKLFILLAILATSLQAQNDPDYEKNTNFGIKLGISASTMFGGELANTTPLMGYVAGIYYHNKLDKKLFHYQTGLDLRLRGSNFNNVNETQANRTYSRIGIISVDMPLNLLIKVGEDLDYMLDISKDEAELIEISKYQVLLNHLQIKMSTKNN